MSLCFFFKKAGDNEIGTVNRHKTCQVAFHKGGPSEGAKVVPLFIQFLAPAGAV